MADTCNLNSPAQPCPSCPWIISNTAEDIPNFDLKLAEGLRKCCPDSRGMGPDFGASMFACHKSKDGAEIACAGWLATVGHRHPGVRLAIAMNRLDAATLRPGAQWPELHPNYEQVLDKLRVTVPAEEQN